MAKEKKIVKPIKSGTPVELSLETLDKVVGGVAETRRLEDEAGVGMLAVANATAQQVAAMSDAQIVSMGTGVADLSDAAVGGLSATQVDALSAAQIAALGVRVAALSTVSAEPSGVAIQQAAGISNDGFTYAGFSRDVSTLQSAPPD